MEKIQQFFEAMMPILEIFYDPSKNGFYLPFVLLTAVVMTIAIRGLQVRKFKELPKNMLNFDAEEGGESPFLAAALSIAGRVGPGNVVGVTVAILMGGPGAIFWMWVAALFILALAFAEATLGNFFNEESPDGDGYIGGPSMYMEKSIPGFLGKLLSKTYLWISLIGFSAFYLVVHAHFTMGGFLSAVSGQTKVLDLTAMSVGTWAVLIAVASAVGALVFLGTGKAMKVTGLLVPVMTGSFFLFILFVMVTNITYFPTFFQTVITEAFNPTQAFVGSASVAFAWGSRRALFATEAGAGAGAIAAATSKVDNPVRAGMAQAFGVFFVVMIGTATGFVILAAGQWEPVAKAIAAADGVGASDNALVAVFNSFQHFAPFGGRFVSLALFFFAFSSLIACCVYAMQIGKSIVRKKSKASQHVFMTTLKIVIISFVLLVPILNAATGGNIFALADFVLSIQLYTNLIAIIILMPILIKIVRGYEKKTKGNWKADATMSVKDIRHLNNIFEHNAAYMSGTDIEDANGNQVRKVKDEKLK